MESNHRRARLQRAALPLSYVCKPEHFRKGGRISPRKCGNVTALERPGRIEPLVGSSATSCSTIELRPRMWWAGMDSNHLRMNGAFTERWAHQCPACLDWRRSEVLIPSGSAPPISLRTSAGLPSGYFSVAEGRGLDPQCSRIQSVSDGCRPPGRLTFLLADGGRIRSPKSSKHMPCGTSGYQDRAGHTAGSPSLFGFGHHGGIRTRGLRLRRAMLCPAELRDGRPVGHSLLHGALIARARHPNTDSRAKSHAGSSAGTPALPP
jgi:hypothetical protein